jgi:hypothetical protein
MTEGVQLKKNLAVSLKELGTNQDELIGGKPHSRKVTLTLTVQIVNGVQLSVVE